MAGRPFPWPRVAVLVVLLGAAGLVLWISGLDTLAAWISVTGVGVTACVVWVVRGIVEWRSGSDAPGLAPRLERAAEDLAAMVQRTWTREAAHRGLTTPLPIAVPMRFADPRIMAHPAQWATPAEAAAMAEGSGHDTMLLTGTVTDVIDLYERVTTGRLVIVGSPGAGKTSAAVLLLLALSAKRRPGDRVPVWFPLASWDPDVTPVEEWMADQLVATYGVPALLAPKLVEGDRILPVLDGLDEIPADRRPAAMAALRSMGTTPLVLTCRTEEYTAVATDGVLGAAAVVETIPVDPSTAADYLAHSGTADARRWDAVVTALRAPEPNPCQEALRSPLMLSLARTVYQAQTADPAELTTYSTVAQLEHRLLDALVKVVYGRDPDDITAADACRWLSFFAHNLPTLGPGAIAWWRLPHCAPRRALHIAAGVATGLAVGIWSSVMILFSFPGALPYVGITVGLPAGIVGAVVGATVSTPSQWRRPRWRDLGEGFKAGIRPGFIVGLLAALLTAIVVGTESSGPWDPESVVDIGLTALSDGLVFGLLVVVGVGFTASFSHQQRDTVTPISAFRTDIKAVFGAGIVSGLAVGLMSWLGVGAMTWFVMGTFIDFGVGLRVALMAGLLVGLGCVFWLGLRRCSAWWYGVTVAILARRGDIPARPLRFLQDAYLRGVLRQAGMVYEFRHARLAEHLRTIS